MAYNQAWGCFIAGSQDGRAVQLIQYTPCSAVLLCCMHRLRRSPLLSCLYGMRHSRGEKQQQVLLLLGVSWEKGAKQGGTVIACRRRGCNQPVCMCVWAEGDRAAGSGGKRWPMHVGYGCFLSPSPASSARVDVGSEQCQSCRWFSQTLYKLTS